MTHVETLTPPRVSVVVPSHYRAVRLRTLLGALEDQTAATHLWEVVVVHDSDDETERLLQSHPLVAAGKLRHIRLGRDTGTAARQRNVGWRAAKGELVAFTDDDCRPDADWIVRLLQVADENFGQIVQGRTRPDPRETQYLAARYSRTLYVDPPSDDAQTCNILYPRSALEALGGFDERLPTPAGEDTDLAARAVEVGLKLIAAPGATVYHAVERYSLRGMLRLSWKWRHLPYLAKRHPQLRRPGSVDRFFWRDSHRRFLLAAVGISLSKRAPAAAFLVLPYARDLATRHGTRPRGLLRSVREIPGAAAVDAVETAGLVSGSARYRTIFL